MANEPPLLTWECGEQVCQAFIGGANIFFARGIQLRRAAGGRAAPTYTVRVPVLSCFVPEILSNGDAR